MGHRAVTSVAFIAILITRPWNNTPLVSASYCTDECLSLYRHYNQFNLSMSFISSIYNNCLKRCGTAPVYVTTTKKPPIFWPPVTIRKPIFYPVSTRSPYIYWTTPRQPITYFPFNPWVPTAAPTTTTPRPTTTTTTKTTTRKSLWWLRTNPTKRPLPSVCGIQPATRRIVGGQPAETCEFPWMANVVSIWFCGGTILDKRHIVTAAHCFKDRNGMVVSPSRVKIRLGSNSLLRTKTYKAERLQVHPRHNVTTDDYDVAVVTLTEDLVFGPCVAPICMAKVGEIATRTNGCYAAGWGVTKYKTDIVSTKLLKVKLPIVPLYICAHAYKTDQVNTLKICAGDWQRGGNDSCTGDSGGPLMCESNGVWVQHGIVSFGKGCGSPYKPGVYTRLSHPDIRKYIIDAIQDVSPQQNNFFTWSYLQ